MPALPKQVTSSFFPGLGVQHEVSLSNVGFHAIEVTIGANSAMTAVQLHDSPPNTLTGQNAPTAIVHSLGAPPSAVIPIPLYAPGDNSISGLTYQYLTADNSAVYLEAWSSTDAGLRGVGTRVLCIR